jgi:predicted TPR repeat methyltransferase
VTDNSMEAALAHHRAGRFDEAETIYRARLAADPKDADALHWLGVLASQCGHHDLGFELIEHALAYRPDNVEMLNNRGNVLNALGRPIEAASAFRRAIILAPGFLEAHYNLGHALKAQGDNEQALQAYQRAVTISPDFVPAQYNLGLVARAIGWTERAMEAFRRCLELDPADASGARLALAALGGVEMPERADPDFVKGLYEKYADNFDGHLVERLSYRAPQIIAETLAVHWKALPSQPGALDLGCGTGLAGVPLKAHLSWLEGVDVSPAMIAKADARGIYDALTVADLLAFLADEHGPYDLVVAADVLIYFGELAPVFAGVARLLTPSGLFAFTTEDAGTDRIRLHQGLRYAHSAEYLRETLAAAGLACLSIAATSTRREDDKPVAGWVVVATPDK